MRLFRKANVQSQDAESQPKKPTREETETKSTCVRSIIKNGNLRQPT